MKLGVVVQRFGEDIAGGSETHCRAIAQRLGQRHDVTVLTSRARDYVSWKNEYAAGESRDGTLRVIRFSARKRRMRRFVEISDRVFGGDCSADEEREWFRENGPRVPALLRYLERHGATFDRILFWTFRYYPSYFGLPRVADRAILVPTAEEDPAIHLETLRAYFSEPRGLLFLTPEEAELVGRHCDRLPPYEIIGTGLEPVDSLLCPPVTLPDTTRDPAPRASRAGSDGDSFGALAGFDLEQPFLLYLGRIDPNKGCGRLLRYYRRYLGRRGNRIPLVLAGEAVMKVPEHPLVRAVGFVPEAIRDRLLAKARMLIVPSRYESLCIALLEAWNHGRPALVDGKCAVLKAQVVRANGGLYYRNYEEFAEAIDLLLERPELASRFGAQGLEYVERNYRWPIVMQRVEEFIAEGS